MGKGLTFDSGGYNLKAGPGSMIELMKFDMGGSAATLGAARILADVQPEGVEVSALARVPVRVAACWGAPPGGSPRGEGERASWQTTQQRQHA